MIIIETITIDGREFTHTYSDTYIIRKVGTDEIYTDAMDVLDFEYEETDTLISDEPTTPEQTTSERIQAAQAANGR